MSSKAPILTIGSSESIALPKYGLKAVPAKIDTGADSSAIWASNIIEKNGQLSFTLFDHSSPYYSGKVITTHDYITTLIKSSFGYTEPRYKIHLAIVLSGRTIRASFTLADRSLNKYPVLIGRGTLHSKFVVDVSRTKNKNAKLQILLLTNNKTLAGSEFVKGLQTADTKLNVTLATYNDLDFIISGTDTSIKLHDTNQNIETFDMVYFKVTARHPDVAVAIAKYLRKRNVSFIDNAIVNFSMTNKLCQYIILNDNGINTPRSVFILNERLADSYDSLVENLGLPFVLKDINGRKGRNNYLIKNKATFSKACQQASLTKVQLIGQTFIENDGDYRILTFGRKIGLVIFRSRLNNETHLNNTSKGGSAKLVDKQNIPAKIQNSCINAAKLLEREIAGIDMVQDKANGTWYCLEVNDGPQLATGVFLKDKQKALAQFLERRLRK